MPSPADVERVLRVADALPAGAEQVSTSERAVVLADQVDDLALQVQARVNLVAAYQAAPGAGEQGAGERGIGEVGWLLRCLADHPREALAERKRFEILWVARFALTRARRASGFPLPALLRLHDEVERGYRAEGASANLPAGQRALLARDVDPPAVLENWVSVWRDSPRDALSGCAACDVATDARLLAESGDLPGALTRAADLLEGRLGCDDEPVGVWGAAADWAVRLGRVDAAEAYHRAGWLAAFDRPGHVSAMAEHVMYLVRSGRRGRAVRLGLSLLPLVTGRPGRALDDLDRMLGTAAAATALWVGRDLGLAPDLVAGQPLDDALAGLESVAADLASAFDDRNGTDHVSRRLAELVNPAAAPDGAQPGTARPRRPAPGQPAAASPEAREADQLEVAVARPAPPFEPREDLPGTPGDFAAALLSASDAFDPARVAELIDGWVDARPGLLPARSPREHYSVAYLERRALSSGRAQQDPALVAELLDGALASAQASGSRSELLRVQVEVAHREALAGDRGAWGRAERLVDELEAIGEPSEAAAALVGLSRDPDAPRGMAHALRAADLFEAADQPRWALTALHAAAYAGMGAHPDRARRILLRAQDAAVVRAVPVLSATTTAALARLAWRNGHLEHALLGYRKALADSGATAGSDPLGVRPELCEVLLETGRWEDLVDEAHDLLAGLAPGDVRGRALGHRLLGLGLLETGNAAEAVEVLEPALLALGRGEEPLVAVASWTLGRALLAGGRPDLAAPSFVRAAAGFRDQARLADAAAAHEAAGTSLGRCGEAAAATDQLRAAVALFRRLPDAGVLASSMRRLAWAQASDGRVSDALRTLDSVLPEVRGVSRAAEHGRGARGEPIDEHLLRGLVDHQKALVLIDGGRADEALPLLEAAYAVLVEHGQDEEAASIAATHRQVLETLGPAPDAAQHHPSGGVRS